jgi:putative oxidoreductase
MATETPSSHPHLSYCDSFAATLQDFLLLVGRVMLGWIFVYSGFMKTFQFIPYSTAGWPAAWFWGPVGAGVELVGGALILLGLGTRYAAILMMLFVIVATFSSHRFWEYPAAQVRLQQSQFFKNVAIFGGFVLIFVTGAGRYAIDAVLRRR